MKTFDIYYSDRKSCPLAHAAEDAVNTMGSPKQHIEAIKALPLTDNIFPFLAACILYWAEAQRWDERNRFAVLASRKLVAQFPVMEYIQLDDKTLKEAFAFTSYAHRYLQNELFKAILVFFEQDSDAKCNEIVKWFNAQEFVYNERDDDLIPYEEYKRTRYGA